jgi:hypothetical protein
VKIHKEGDELLSTLGNTLSEKEMGFIKEVMESAAVLTPTLLIKDHKAMNSKGRRICDETNCSGNKFHSGIPKGGIPGNQKHF